MFLNVKFRKDKIFRTTHGNEEDVVSNIRALCQEYNAFIVSVHKKPTDFNTEIVGYNVILEKKLKSQFH